MLRLLTSFLITFVFALLVLALSGALPFVFAPVSALAISEAERISGRTWRLVIPRTAHVRCPF